MPKQPNILFIVTDQQSATMMSCTGNPYVNTPNLDKLAAAGTRFERAYCANPVCLPSRLSMFTGRMPSEFGVWHNDSPSSVNDKDAEQALGSLVSNGGYDCYYGGKVHLPSELHPTKTGYEYFTNDERGKLAEESAKIIKSKHEKPFFMVCSFINPHDICFMAIRDSQQTEQEKKTVANGKVETATLDDTMKALPGTDLDEFFANHCPPLPYNHEPQKDEPEAIHYLINSRPFKQKIRNEWNDRQWRMHRWAYARLTEQMDAQVGLLLDALEESGQLDNTLIIFTSDHGDQDSSHRLEHKTVFYEESARIPLIMSYPGKIPAGRIETESLISNGLDLAPTICDYAGVGKSELMKGHSLRQCAENIGLHERSEVYMESEIAQGIVKDDFKVVHFDFGENSRQLYDLSEDIHELRNHSDVKPEKYAYMSNVLEKYQQEYGRKEI